MDQNCMEAKHKHLEFIQLTITRMAANSFLLKNWSVTLVAALMAISANDSSPNRMLLALLPTVIFWGLDGYFLWQEKLYRDLYDSVRVKTESDNIDYSLDATGFISRTNSWYRACTRDVQVLFYMSLILGVGLVWYIVGTKH